MRTSVIADRLDAILNAKTPQPGTPVIRVKQGTDELVIRCSTYVAAENNAVILQQMFDKANLGGTFFPTPEDASKNLDGYKVVGYFVRVQAAEPADGCGKAKIGGSGLWMSWQAKLEPVAELSPA